MQDVIDGMARCAVTPSHRLAAGVQIADIPFDEMKQRLDLGARPACRHTRIVECGLEIVAMAGGEVVETDHALAEDQQVSSRLLPMKPATPVTSQLRGALCRVSRTVSYAEKSLRDWFL